MRTHHLRLPAALLGTLAAFTAGCASPRTAVQQYGGMREVLHDGKSQPRLALADVTTRPHAYGVGAMAHLEGEITILDGDTLITRADGATVHTSVPQRGDAATLLSVAYVDQWSTTTLASDLEGAALEQAIHDIAAAHGTDPTTPFAFVIEGTVSGLSMHVINGACPIAGDPAGTHAPWPLRLDASTPATLVGIYAEGRQGEMTHHGSTIHLHAIVQHDGQRTTGHVESIRVHRGAAIRTPQRP